MTPLQPISWGWWRCSYVQTQDRRSTSVLPNSSADTLLDLKHLLLIVWWNSLTGKKSHRFSIMVLTNVVKALFPFAFLVIHRAPNASIVCESFSRSFDVFSYLAIDKTTFLIIFFFNQSRPDACSIKHLICIFLLFNGQITLTSDGNFLQK